MKWAGIFYLLLKIGLKFFQYKTNPERAHREALDELVSSMKENIEDFDEAVIKEDSDAVWRHLDALDSSKLRERIDQTPDGG